MNSTVLTLNRWAGPALALAWPMLWQSSLLIAFLFALDFAFRRRLRASVRYALWLVVLLKLALPPSLALPTGLGWWLRPAAAAPARPRQVSMVVTYGPAQAVWHTAPISLARAAPAPARLSAGAWGLAAWGAVSLGLLGWMLVRWRQVAREAGRAAPAPDGLEELFVQAQRSQAWRGHPARRSGWLEQLFTQARRLSGLHGPARLRLIERPMSPAVCGLFRPVILLPRALAEQLPPDQLRAVLVHELVHLRRGDVWLSFLQALLQIVYWWHPLLWAANARIRRAREEAVDDAVMLALEDKAEAYAPTLLEVARLALSRPPVSLGLVGILETGTFLRQRLERLLDFRPPRKAGLTLASVFSVAAFAALALPMGQAPAPAEKPEPAAASTRGSEKDVDSRKTTTDFTNFTDGPAPAPEEHRSSRSEVLLQDGKLLYEMGKLDEAEAKLEEARRLDPRTHGDRMSFIRTLEAEGTTLERYRKRAQAVDYYLNLIREARSNEVATPSQEHGSSKSKAAQLVQDGKLLYEMGKLDEAEHKLKQARKEDPENDGAYYYLNLVTEAKFHIAANERDSLPKPGPYARTNLIFTGRGRRVIVSKLDSIRLDEVPIMDNLPLSEVVLRLDGWVKKRDPEGRGINFIIAPSADPATGLPISGQGGAEPVDMNTIGIRISPALHDIRLADFLEVLVKAADKPIKYSIEDYAVVFSLKGRETTPLYFRTIKVDPNTFVQGLQGVFGLDWGTLLMSFAGSGSSGSGGLATVPHVNIAPSDGMMGGNGPEKLGAIIHQFFAELGVDLSPPKSVFYNDRQGTLLVYATLADLDIIERAVQVLNIAPPQIKIQAVFIELPKAEVEAFWETFGSTNVPAPGSAKTATLTHSQAAALLDHWKSMGGTNTLGQFQVTTLGGRQVEVGVEDVGTTLTTGASGQANPGRVPFGPTLVIIPNVTPDRVGVQMDLVAKVAEFIGSDDPGPFAVILDSNTAPATVILPFPHFLVRQVVNAVEVRDGQTVILGGLTSHGVSKTTDRVTVFGDQHFVSRLFRNVSGWTYQRDILILVTPTIVDPAGNPVHPQNK
jgi:beta-lactamase regulating signal transducer with metallopeptidase domain